MRVPDRRHIRRADNFNSSASWTSCRARRSLGALVPCVLGALLSGCSHGTESTAAAKPVPPPVAVTVVDLERRTVERTIEIEGTLKAWEEVSVSAKIGGHVKRVAVDMGDRLRPGDLLVELDPVDANLALREAGARYVGELTKLGVTQDEAEEFVKRYGADEALLYNADIERIIRELPASRQAQASRDKARQELSRQQGLSSRGVGVAQDLINAQNDYQAAQAAVDNVQLTVRTNLAAALTSRVALDVARQNMADLSIVVPTPSTTPPGQTRAAEVVYAVSRRPVHEGQRIKDGETVLELVVDDPVRLWANVPERFRSDVVEGQSVRIAAMASPGVTFEGRVARINPAVDPVSRTFQLEALIPNAEGKLRPGGFAKGQVVLRTDAQAVVVPIESVYRFAGVTKIYLIENETSRGYSVELGEELDGKVEVVGTETPLPETGQVVDTGQSVLAKLAEGTRVVVRAPDRGPLPPRTDESTKPHTESEAHAKPHAPKTD